jgi:hypothetical protein
VRVAFEGLRSRLRLRLRLRLRRWRASRLRLRLRRSRGRLQLRSRSWWDSRSCVLPRSLRRLGYALGDAVRRFSLERGRRLGDAVRRVRSTGPASRASRHWVVCGRKVKSMDWSRATTLLYSYFIISDDFSRHHACSLTDGGLPCLSKIFVELVNLAH